jgi:molybdopterin-guanine dinucleotide biosynthesis protein A
MIKPNVTCIILAGGKGSRMGLNKSFIKIAGIQLFDYVYSKCQDIFQEVIIVTNKSLQLSFSEYQAHIVIDDIPGAGPLGGLYTGLIKASNYHTYCVACDMPFLQPELIIHLAEKRFDYDVVIPKTKEGLEPLHAFYSKRCIEPIKNFLERSDFKLTKFLSEVLVKYCEEEEIKKIDPSLISFTNVNTKNDLIEIYRMLKGVPWEEKIEVS